MSQPLLVALFENHEDVQSAFNEITQSGFDDQDISLIMTNTREEDEPEENDEDYESELDDGAEDAHGLIDPIAVDDQGASLEIPDLGEVIFAGPIASIVSDLETEKKDDVSTELELTKVLTMMGVPIEDTTAYENCLKNDYTIIAVPVEEENVEEIRGILSNNGAESVEYTKAEW